LTWTTVDGEAFFLLFVTISVAGQRVDTIIVNKAYTSYFNYQLHEPLYVVYKLYRGGGDCSRKSLRFKTDNLPYSAKASDYKGSGYDQGHLANAEDFANDCEKEELTFRFYNCVPQTSHLNRGIWKQFETIIRKDSQRDSLLVICGSIFGGATIGAQQIAVPDKCWKVVISLTSKEVTYCVLFDNDNAEHFKHLTLSALKKLLPYQLKY
jgi:endonuclease G